MSVSRRRVRAIFRKELREYRRNRTIVTGMAILPLLFLIQPLVAVLNLGASASGGLAHEHELLYLLAIPALVSATLASYSVVGERQQGTLEPVLGTPIRREEFLLGKALASFVPSVAISYAVYAFFLAVVEIFAQPGVASALLRGSDLLASLPSVVVTSLIAFNVIRPSLVVALGGAVVLLVLNRLGWRITSAMFDRERLITGTR
jgi:ABC-type transport system involved in multi-copper enzyme maturation permease subunit